MKPWQKSPEALIRRFNALLPVHPDAQPRQMFGYPACFVKGGFFIGLHEAHVVVRLPDGLQQQFPELKGARPFDPMGGRPMKAWFVLPPPLVANDARLAAFMARALEVVRQLPPKAKAKPKRKAKKPSKR